MPIKSVNADMKIINRCFWRSLVMCSIAVALLPTGVRATENGACVYPVGVETVLPGLTSPPKRTMFEEFTILYTANQMNNSSGVSSVPEFKLRVFANAIRILHNWNIPVLGGKLNSNIAIPTIYERLHNAQGNFNKFGLSNVDIGVLQVGYNTGPLHWFYKGDVFLPGAPYVKTDIIYTGQHNYAAGPVSGLTWLPRHGELEASSKFLYIVNFHDTASHYRSGNEFVWEYDAMKEVSKRMALGVNGYFYQQTTNDMQNGLTAGDGFRGRDLAVGPEARIHFGKRSVLAVKYIRDTLVENKPKGNAFWFQMGIPVSLGMGTGRGN